MNAKVKIMKNSSLPVLIALLAASPLGFAAAEKIDKRPAETTMIVVEPISKLPLYNSVISAWYKASVYDENEKKVADVEDMLVNSDGTITAAMLSVGGFLGMGEKHVAVPLNAITWTKRDNKAWLTINTTKETLKRAVGYKFDKQTERWEPIAG
jgi:hypothetical protein